MNALFIAALKMSDEGNFPISIIVESIAVNDAGIEECLPLSAADVDWTWNADNREFMITSPKRFNLRSMESTFVVFRVNAKVSFLMQRESILSDVNLEKFTIKRTTNATHCIESRSGEDMIVGCSFVKQGVGRNYGSSINIYSQQASRIYNHVEPRPSNIESELSQESSTPMINEKKRSREVVEKFTDDLDDDVEPPKSVTEKKLLTINDAATSSENDQFPVPIRVMADGDDGSKRIFMADEVQWKWDDSSKTISIDHPKIFDIYHEGGSGTFCLSVGGMTLQLRPGSCCLGVDAEKEFVGSADDVFAHYAFGPLPPNSKPVHIGPGNVSMVTGIGMQSGSGGCSFGQFGSKPNFPYNPASGVSINTFQL